MKKYLGICKLTAEELMKRLATMLLRLGYQPTQAEEYLYAPGEIPILLVAHVDTAHYKPPEEVFYDPVAGVAWSPDGLGADDRAGVAGILELLRRGYRPHVLFCDGEESGGTGASAAAKELAPPDVRYLVELDRRNGKDAVFYNCDNKEFKEYIENFGFVETFGTFSDISILTPAWRIAGVNLSIGYYNQHMATEFIRCKEWEHILGKVEAMLKNPPRRTFVYKAKVSSIAGSSKGISYWRRDEWDEFFVEEGDDYQWSFRKYKLGKVGVFPSITSYTLSKVLGGEASDWCMWLERHGDKIEEVMEEAGWALVLKLLEGDPVPGATTKVEVESL